MGVLMVCLLMYVAYKINASIFFIIGVGLWYILYCIKTDY